MLASLLSKQLDETLDQAKLMDDERVRQAAAGVPRAFLPASGQRERDAAQALRSFIDVAQTLERSAFAGDTRAQAELVSFARYLCADDCAAELSRRFTWENQGGKALVLPRRVVVGPTHTAPRNPAALGSFDAPVLSAVSALPPKPNVAPDARRKATPKLIAATAAWLQQAWS